MKELKLKFWRKAINMEGLNFKLIMIPMKNLLESLDQKLFEDHIKLPKPNPNF